MTKLLEETLKHIGPLDSNAMQAARERQDNLTKPQGSLGRLEELSIRLAGIQGKALPEIKHKVVITMAADHGVTAEGVSLYPADVTAQMVLNFLNGRAAVNVLARTAGVRVVVVDMGVAQDLKANPNLVSRKIAYGTKNMAKGPAMSREEAIKAIETGIEIVNGERGKGMDIVGTGEMGIGNTTPSAAIAAVMTGKTVLEVTGRGTGIGDMQLAHKVEVINRSIAVNRPDSSDAIDVLAKVGGFEIGGLAGVILGAAANHTLVVIDGFISGAAALIAAGLSPEAKDYMIAGHVSVEPGHKIILEHLGLKALLDLNMRLGEGTGAVLAMFLAQSAADILSGMATFAEAGVSERND